MPAPDFVIRDMAASDTEPVVDLIWELNRYENALSSDRATDRDSARACLAANERRVAPEGRHLVAERAGRVVGYACCGLVEGEPFIRTDLRLYGYVFELVVAPDCRGAGIGGALLAACETHIRSKGVKSIGIGVLAANRGAIRLYERMGFAPHVIEKVKWLG